MQFLPIFFLVFLFSSYSVQAGKIHKAHVHGAAELTLAYEGNLLSIELEGPADGFLGFEHAPKSEEEKKQLEELKKSWNAKLQEVLGLTGLDECTVKESALELELDGKHAEIMGKGTLECPSAFKGRKIEVKTAEKFPRLEKITFKLLRQDGSAINKKLGKKTETVEL